MKVTHTLARSRLSAVAAVLMALFALPQFALAQEKCPSGAKRERGKCVCPSGQRIAPDGKRCVSTSSTSTLPTPGKVKEPKIKAKAPAAVGEYIPVDAKVQILELTKDDYSYGSRSQYVGKEGVVVFSDLFKTASGKGRDYYSGTINIDGAEYYFDQVSVAILGFGAVAATTSGAHGDFVPGSSVVKITDISSSDLYFKDKKKLKGLQCTVESEGLVPTGGAWYGGPVACDDGSSWYFYQFTFDMVKLAESTVSACAAGAATGTTINGRRVEILDVSADDAYYSSRSSIIGKQGYVGEDSSNTSPSGMNCWFAGSFTADDGTSYYFYQVQVKDLGSAPAPACLAGASTASGFKDGERVTVLDVGTGDAYYGDRGAIVGKSGKVSGDLHNNGGCWFGGGFTADDGTYYYFAQAQFSYASGGSASSGGSCAAGASTASSFTDGTRVTIVDIDSSDLFFKEKSKLVGASGKVSGDLHNNGGCWFGGGFTADDGKYYYFAKIQVKSAGTSASIGGGTGACAASASTAKAFKDGESVTILDISPDDAYYPSRSSIIGLKGKASGEMANAGGCWFGGGFTADNGTYYYFLKAQVSSGTAKPKAEIKGLKAYTGAALKTGSWVIILDIAPEDAFYKDRASMIGKRCQVSKGTLASSGGSFYGGNVACDDGTTYYLFKASVSVAK